MLLVNAKKGPSQIHGLGLISQEFISAGTRIWRFESGFDVELSEEQASLLSPVAQQQLHYYAYFDSRTQRFVLSSDYDRFTNHSNKPNTALDLDGVSTIAQGDIQPGEEITWDYQTPGQAASTLEQKLVET